MGQVSDTRDAAALMLYEALEEAGSDVGVLKFSSTAVDTLYKQGKHVYDAPVSVKGAASLGMTEEMVNIFGNDSEWTGSITFTRTHLQAAFPGADLETVIGETDRVVVFGKQWRVTGTRPSARLLGSEPEIMYLIFDHIRTKRREAYP